jgi:hypothetical protein
MSTTVGFPVISGRHRGRSKPSSTSSGNIEGYRRLTFMPVREGRISRRSGFDQGFELHLAVDDFDDVLHVPAILLLLEVFGLFQHKFVEVGA